MNKIFCKYCKYFKYVCSVYYVPYTDGVKKVCTPTCRSECNIKYSYDWFGIDKIYDESPKSRNENNDCKWFVPKWWVRYFVPRRKWDISW